MDFVQNYKKKRKPLRKRSLSEISEAAAMGLEDQIEHQESDFSNEEDQGSDIMEESSNTEENPSEVPPDAEDEDLAPSVSPSTTPRVHFGSFDSSSHVAETELAKAAKRLTLSIPEKDPHHSHKDCFSPLRADVHEHLFKPSDTPLLREQLQAAMQEELQHTRELADHEIKLRTIAGYGLEAPFWSGALDPSDGEFCGYFPLLGRLIEVAYFPRAVRNYRYRVEDVSYYVYQRNLLRFAVLGYFSQMVTAHTYAIEMGAALMPQPLTDPLLITCKWFLIEVMHGMVHGRWSDVEVYHTVYGPMELTVELAPPQPFYCRVWPPGLCVDRAYPYEELGTLAFTKNIKDIPFVRDPLRCVQSIADFATKHVEVRGLDKASQPRQPKTIVGWYTPENNQKFAPEWDDPIVKKALDELPATLKAISGGSALHKRKAGDSVDVKDSGNPSIPAGHRSPFPASSSSGGIAESGSHQLKPASSSRREVSVSGHTPVHVDHEHDVIMAVDPSKQFIMSKFDKDSVESLAKDYKRKMALKLPFDRDSIIDRNTRQTIDWVLGSFDNGGKYSEADRRRQHWKQMSDSAFINLLKSCLDHKDQKEDIHYLNLYNHHIHFDSTELGKATVNNWSNDISRLYSKFLDNLTEVDEAKRPETEREIIEHWLEKWNLEPKDQGLRAFIGGQLDSRKAEIPRTISGFVGYVTQFVREKVVQVAQYYNTLEEYVPANSHKKQKRSHTEEDEGHGGTTPQRAGNKNHGQGKNSSSSGGNPPHASAGVVSEPCNICGMQHMAKYCGLRAHPDANLNPHVPFAQSAKGAKYVALGFTTLRTENRLNDDQTGVIPLPQDMQRSLKDACKTQADRKRQDQRGNKKQDTSKGEFFAAINREIDDSDLYSTVLRLQDGVAEVAVRVLIDPGNLGPDLISLEKLEELRSLGIHVDTENTRTIRSAIKSSPSVSCVGSVNVDVRINNDLTNSFEFLPITVCAIPMDGMDMILSLKTYKKYNLHDKLRSHFVVSKEQRRDLIDLLANVIESKDFFGEPTQEDYEFPPTDSSIYDAKEPFEVDSSKDALEQLLDHITFGGSGEFKKQLREVCRRHIRVFSKQLTKDPALVDPMRLQVDEQRWRLPKNCRGPRVVSPQKEEEIRKEVEELLKMGVIRPSQATHYSQVVLVKKPDGTWRFCVDFRNLNEVMQVLYGWRLPRIEEISHRVVSARPKFFGKADFTKGYFQAEMDEESKKYTAFITPFGCYEFERVAMGLSPAPSYFQYQISQTVLKELNKGIVEHYIDDILLHAQTEEEFLEKLEMVLTRLEMSHIYLNPKKCIFGTDSVEFLGYQFDEKGRTMPIKRVQEVVDFPLPRNKKQLKSFIGLANFFHKFVPGCSSLQKPLNDLLIDYSKKRRMEAVQWNDKALESFQTMKALIGNCPRLDAIDENQPLILQTDASDYGIGAFLFQQSDRANPDTISTIGFFSKSLTSHQLNWSTIEKEAYAIVAAVKYWEFLLSGRKFELETDHLNLRYMNEACAPKVIRWKLMLQEYDFNIRHIPGPQNVIADFLSRVPPEKDLLERIEKAKSTAVVCAFVDAEDRNDDIPIHRPLSGSEYAECLCGFLEDYKYTPAQYEIIKSYHNAEVGHFGVKTTLERLEKYGHKWEHVRVHVRKFIRECPVCQKLSYEQPEVFTKPYTVATLKPMEVIALDHIGPLKVKGQEDDRYILVMIDCFTRFIELYAVEAVDANTTAACLLSFFGRYGVPLALRTDRGTAFVNDVCKELSVIAAYDHVFTLAHSKEENSIVERANKEIMRHLRAIFLQGGIAEAFPEDLWMVQRIMNSATHSSFGVAPATLLFGNSIDLDRQILYKEEYDRAKFGTTQPLSDWVRERFQRQQKLLQVAASAQNEIDVTNMAKRTPKDITHFPVGTYVLAKHPAGRMGNLPPSKLQSYWQGLYCVADIDGPVYTVKDLITDEKKVFHVCMLKAFEYDKDNVDPMDVVLTEAQLHLIEKVTDHKDMGNPPKGYIRDIQFKVKWKHTDVEDWLPWKDVRTNFVVHDYMKGIPALRRKVPRT